MNLDTVLDIQSEIDIISNKISQVINEKSSDFESLKSDPRLLELKSSLDQKKEELKQESYIIKSSLKKWYNLLLDYEKSILNKSIVLKENLSEIERSFLNISAKELDNLNQIRGELCRLFLSPFQKHQKRLSILGLSYKFSNEGNNALSYEYGVLYLKLLGNLAKLKGNNDTDLQEAYDYLDDKDFQNHIPNKYLLKLESYPELIDLVKEIKPLMKKLSS